MITITHSMHRSVPTNQESPTKLVEKHLVQRSGATRFARKLYAL